MNVTSMLTFFLPLLGAPIGPATDPVAKERQALAGTWVIETAKWSGLPIILPGKGAQADTSITWSFEGSTFKAFVGGAEPEAGTFGVDLEQSPKHLDLVPPKGSQLGLRKCLYTVSGDELTIAMSLWFAPGTPDDEAKEAAKMRSTRPTTLGGNRDDLILLLTLKRQNK